jgi:hypothetical protein
MNQTKLKLHKKSIDSDCNAITDILKAFNLLLPKKDLYHITLTDINVNHVQELNHILTNKFFNTIHKDYRQSFEFINYLFIIEYGGAISKPSISPTGASLPKDDLCNGVSFLTGVSNII